MDLHGRYEPSDAYFVSKLLIRVRHIINIGSRQSRYTFTKLLTSPSSMCSYRYYYTFISLLLYVHIATTIRSYRYYYTFMAATSQEAAPGDLDLPSSQPPGYPQHYYAPRTPYEFQYYHTKLRSITTLNKTLSTSTTKTRPRDTHPIVNTKFSSYSTMKSDISPRRNDCD